MGDQHLGNPLTIESPGNYQIEVQGVLSGDWSDRLAGMSIQTGISQSGASITTLSGYLRDQAQLSGILNSLYELHLPILSVALLAEDEEGK